MLQSNIKLPPLDYHSVVLVTHKNGQKSSVEKGEHCDIVHNTIVKHPEEMSTDFKSYSDSVKPFSILRVGDLIRAGDQGSFDHLVENCNHAVQGMKDRARGIAGENKSKKTS